MLKDGVYLLCKRDIIKFLFGRRGGKSGNVFVVAAYRYSKYPCHPGNAVQMTVFLNKSVLYSRPTFARKAAAFFNISISSLRAAFSFSS